MSESRSLFGAGAKLNDGGGSVTKVLNFDDAAAEAGGGRDRACSPKKTGAWALL